MDENTAKMLGSVGGAAISGGLGMLDSYLTRRYNERMIDKQNAWNLAQWNRENAYNHPAAVTARLKQAGINPALAYMNGASFAPAATSPQSGASQARSFGLQMDPMTLSNIRLQNAQADLAKAEAENVEQKTPLEVEGLSRTNQKILKEIEDFRHRWEAMDVENQYKNAMRLNIRFEQTMRSKEYQLQKKKVEQEIENMKSKKELTDAQVKRAKYDLDYLVKTEVMRIAGLSLQNAKTRAEIGLTRNEMNNAFKTGQLLGYQVNSGWTEDMYQQMRIKEVKDWMEQNSKDGLPFSYALEEMILHSLRKTMQVVK